ncbi:hypothetical protein [Halegenticoccus tardaugens]|uniref:hypothetical protein n=1 Tax=Halegenticoccus tardaugens TaxID=2071624 RepID=UPI003742CA10
MVADLDDSVSFYMDVVGLKPNEATEGNVEFETGRRRLSSRRTSTSRYSTRSGSTIPGTTGDRVWSLRSKSKALTRSIRSPNGRWPRTRRSDGTDRHRLGSTENAAGGPRWLHPGDLGAAVGSHPYTYLMDRNGCCM